MAALCTTLIPLRGRHPPIPMGISSLPLCTQLLCLQLLHGWLLKLYSEARHRRYSVPRHRLLRKLVLESSCIWPAWACSCRLRCACRQEGCMLKIAWRSDTTRVQVTCKPAHLNPLWATTSLAVAADNKLIKWTCKTHFFVLCNSHRLACMAPKTPAKGLGRRSPPAQFWQLCPILLVASAVAVRLSSC